MDWEVPENDFEVETGPIIRKYNKITYKPDIKDYPVWLRDYKETN